jgi:hypothetical protein
MFSEINECSIMLDILETNKKIIINTDIDGVLSGLILTNYASCEVVGFSNSKNTVWIDDSKINSIYTAVYVDMFVADNNVKCIDQHIVAVNEQHHNILNTNANKINPNFENPRFHLPNHSYYNKYPFGTVHYIIAVLESEGIRVNLDFMNPVGSLKFIDFLLRADDAMTTTLASNYMTNASSWWQWLLRKSCGAKSIATMRAYLNTLNEREVFAKKQTTTSILTNPTTFGCTSPDGGYQSIIDIRGRLLPNVRTYFDFLAQSSGLECFNFDLNLTPFVGRVNRTSLSTIQINDLIKENSINGERIFSYAFVRSAIRDKNFSYTIM